LGLRVVSFICQKGFLDFDGAKKSVLEVSSGSGTAALGAVVAWAGGSSGAFSSGCCAGPASRMSLTIAAEAAKSLRLAPGGGHGGMALFVGGGRVSTVASEGRSSASMWLDTWFEFMALGMGLFAVLSERHVQIQPGI
jgi:hypothetical protein